MPGEKRSIRVNKIADSGCQSFFPILVIRKSPLTSPEMKGDFRTSKEQEFMANAKAEAR